MENLAPDLTASALPFALSSQATLNFSTLPPANAPVWPAASRKLQLSPKEWHDLKPIIQQLYIDESKRFQDVAKILQTNYNFTPTEKQFDDKIKKWGLRKNATHSQRAVILQELHNGECAEELKKSSLKLNAEKIERWEREERLSGSIGKLAVQQGKMVKRQTWSQDRRPPDRALSPLRQDF